MKLFSKNAFIGQNRLPFAAFVSTYTAWVLTGGYRGYSLYAYKNNKAMKAYEEGEKNKTFGYNPKPDNFYYVDAAINVAIGFLFYMNPVCLPFSMYRELYRVEVNARKLTDELETDKYYNLI